MSENKFCSILFASGGTQEHEGRNQWFQQRPRSTDQGQHAGARGAEPVVPTEAPQQRPGRRQPLRNLFTEASGTEQFLQAGLYFLLPFGVDFFSPAELRKFDKGIGD